MPDPNNKQIYRGRTGMQSKVPAMERGRSQPGGINSHAANASPPLGVGQYSRPGSDSAGSADPPLGVGTKVGI